MFRASLCPSSGEYHNITTYTHTHTPPHTFIQDIHVHTLPKTYTQELPTMFTTRTLWLSHLMFPSLYRQNTTCSRTRSYSPDDGHNDARNMLGQKFNNKQRISCILLVPSLHLKLSSKATSCLRITDISRVKTLNIAQRFINY